uniref:Leucine-rich repeat-containing protein 75A n=1 Tax=Malurus cyaneus samueli TaxID=2593467 RepID=A0A8C5X1G0_9PASS
MESRHHKEKEPSKNLQALPVLTSAITEERPGCWTLQNLLIDKPGTENLLTHKTGTENLLIDKTGIGNLLTHKRGIENLLIHKAVVKNLLTPKAGPKNLLPHKPGTENLLPQKPGTENLLTQKPGIENLLTLRAVLMGKPQDNTVDLSGIPLSLKDVEKVTSYLEQSSEHISAVELGFTELTDELLLQLLPALGRLPRLTSLALNGNRLTKAVLRDLTDTLKDPKKFPSITWIDLGNNVDIFSLPQPFLVSLKRRCPKQGNLPTILEFGEGQHSDLEGQDGFGAGQEELRSPSQAGSTDWEEQMDRMDSEKGAATPRT